MIETEAHKAETAEREEHGRSAPPPARPPAARTERDLLVPLVDEQEAGRIYDPSIHRWAAWGALTGAALLGGLGWALAGGTLPVAGLGQWAAAGPAVGAFTGARLGTASGGLAGALLALYRLPPRSLHDVLR